MMFKNYLTAFILLCLLSFQGFAQVGVDKPVQMTGSTDSDREIKNVGAPAAADHAINTISLQENLGRYSQAAGADSIYFNVAPSISNYTPGTTLYFKAATTNTGPVTLNVNGLGVVPLKKAAVNDLIAGDIKANMIVAVVYDGSNFQLVSNNALSCPAGFADVNSKFCIEINERTASGFFPAAVTCSDLNYRLCTWGEWYYACQKSGLGLSAMTNNYEWTNDATNGDNVVRVAGNGSCTTAGGLNAVTSSQPFRCCFSK